MQSLREIKEWIGLDEAEEARLRALWPLVEPSMPGIIEHFYERIMASPRAAAVFESEAQIERQKRVLAVWTRQLLLGPWDEDYAIARRRIGERHVEIGLDHVWMFTAMEVMRDSLCKVAWTGLPYLDAMATCRAISHICALDLALMTGEYSGLREEARVASARGLLLSHLPSAAMLVDAFGRVTEANILLDELAGEAPRRGRVLTEALPPALCEAARLADALEEARGLGEPVTRERVDVVLNGREHVLRVRVVPLDGQGAALLHLEELTDVVDAEARARRAESLARVGELSAAIAHELRNPLAGISGAIQVLAGSFDATDRRASVMQRVRDQVGRLDRMVRDLLAFSRPPAARMDRVNLHDIVDHVLDLVREEAGGIALVRTGEGTARADTDLLHRVILNLVQNALAMQGVRRVEIHVSDGSVSVRDDGPGVPDNLKDRIFEPFFTTRTTGTGLGLAICRNATEAMGGTLKLEDVPRGAAFSMRLAR